MRATASSFNDDKRSSFCSFTEEKVSLTLDRSSNPGVVCLKVLLLFSSGVCVAGEATTTATHLPLFELSRAHECRVCYE